MTLVGKILTVLILVVSVAFMMLATAVFATHRNWRDVGLALKDEVLEVQRTNEQLRAEKERERDRLALEQAARRFALAALQSRLAIIEDARDSSAAQLAEVQAENGELVETLNTNQIAMQKLTDEVARLREGIREARQARDEKFLEVARLTDEVMRIEGTRQTLQERHQQLQAQVSRMQNVLDRNELTEFDPVDPDKPPRVDGIVTAVGQTDLIEISIGSDDGLRTGHKLDIFRRNSYLGRIVITDTQPDRAVGKILREYRKGIIKKGDRVATKLS